MHRFFGLLIAIAELGVWPPLGVYFGFLNMPSGRAWLMLFIALLCLSNGVSRNQGRVDHILLTVAGVCGVVLAIIGFVIRKDPAVVNRNPVEVPAGVAGVFKRGGSGGANTGGSANATSPDVAI